MAIRQLNDAEFEITDTKEAAITIWFGDIGAVVYMLKAIPWQIPDFTIDRSRHELERLHERMSWTNGLVANGTRFYVEAIKEKLSSPS